MKKTKNAKVVTRFAPSPTGFLHVGNYRTALFACIFARQNGGTFLLRIEDTDKARSKKEYEDNIIESLEWLGLAYDGFERQSGRAPIHRKYLEQMIASGHAFVSKEIPKEHGDRKEVIRFKNPNKKVSFNDICHGQIEFDTTDLGDFVIAKSLNEPVFHLAVVADDHDMGVTHVIRGEDHISNTPRQILIHEALGWQVPNYAHIPLLLAPDRSKLSKRKGALAMTEYRNQGYLPEAIVNFLALLGWNPGTDQEILSMEDLVEKFSLEKVQKGGAIMNEEKLRWVNKEYLKKLPKKTQEEEVKKRIISSEKAKEKKWHLPDDLLAKILPVVLDRIEVWSDITEMISAGELDYFFGTPEYAGKSLLWKGEGTPTETIKRLENTIALLKKIPDGQFSAEKTKAALWDYATAEGRGNVLWPMRFALSGKEKSPDPFILSEILGKDETLKRLSGAISKLK